MKPFHHRIIPAVVDFGRRRHWLFAGFLLAAMFVLGITSMAGNSAIVDEVAHIPAAYSYLHYGDYRLNPEHPPLIKDLAGLPLQFMHLKFPDQEPGWTDQSNGEWETGWNFLYHIGNNAYTILFWARLPILLLGIAFGIVLYAYCRRRWGVAVGLLALLFYTLSPNIIAHSSLVTTDLGASAFMFIALIGFIRYIEKPGRGNFLLLSLAIAAALLAKDSAVLLFPLFVFISLLLVIIGHKPTSLGGRIKAYLGGLIGPSLLSLIWVWLYYIPHTINMPTDVQVRLIDNSLTTGVGTHMVPLLDWMAHIPILKALAQYLLGVTMVLARVSGGNVTYFNGMVTDGSYRGYFPELFVLKTQIAFLILGLAVLAFALYRFFRHKPFLPSQQIAGHFRRNLMEWVMAGFAVFYFGISIMGNLDLGIRHVLPIYVPLFVLVAIGTVKIVRALRGSQWAQPARLALAALLLWYTGATFAAYPSYLSYFNEFIGGGQNAENYFSDSSVDWGQDLLRLKTYVADHPQINRIAVDYFGGADPRYYFCNRKYDANHQLIATVDGYDCTNSVFEEWHSQYGVYTGQYIAVSETFLENDRYYAAVNGTVGYDYLREREPIAKIGNSIYVYKMY